MTRVRQFRDQEYLVALRERNLEEWPEKVLRRGIHGARDKHDHSPWSRLGGVANN